MLPRSGVSRRDVLASLGVAPITSGFAQPSISDEALSQAHCGSADFPRTQTVFSALLRVSLATPADATVGSAIILGGNTTGTLAGIVQPGSLEWIRDPTRGVLQMSARFEVQVGAGLRIHVSDRATVVTPTTACWDAPFATTPEVTVVDGSTAACQDAVYLGRMDASQIHAGQLRLTVHRVL